MSVVSSPILFVLVSDCFGTTVANSRETNKQPQLQKQAQYVFDDLLSSIYLLTIIDN